MEVIVKITRGKESFKEVARITFHTKDQRLTEWIKGVPVIAPNYNNCWCADVLICRNEK